MIDIEDETLLSLTDAARVRPRGRNGQPTHVSTVYRWIACGVRGVRLEAIRLGGQLYTSKEALQRFAERLTHPRTSLPPAQTNPGFKSRRLAVERAERQLDQARI